MERRRLTSAAVALLSAIVVGVAAATLGETTTRSGEPGIGGEGSGGLPSRDISPMGEVAPGIDLLGLLAVVIVVIAVLSLVGVVLFPRETLKQTLVVGAATAILAVAWWLVVELMDGVASTVPPGGSNSSETPDGVLPGGGGGAGGSGVTIPDPTAIGLLVVGLVGLGILTMLVRESRSTAETEPAGANGAALSAIGRSAGRAADRIADADAPLDNEVYRAWKEMTGYLDLEVPATRTPEEFRLAARSAGMAPADTDSLTDLFREVRYGGARATAEREASATEALRRIEERYADEERTDDREGPR